MDYKQKSIDIRRNILKMIHNAKSGHTGGSLSSVEILIALYYECMNIDTKNGKIDGLIISHANELVPERFLPSYLSKIFLKPKNK